jgi:hypothetical protein
VTPFNRQSDRPMPHFIYLVLFCIAGLIALVLLL